MMCLQVIDIGFRFVDLLLATENWALAEDVIKNIIIFLQAQPAVENWVSFNHQ
jgi:hypothetical protein